MKKIIIGIAAVGIFVTGCGSSEGGLSKAGAMIACENAIKGKLKSAGSADFNGVKATQADSGPWSVAGSVDSQNGFGAMVTTDFACEVTYIEEGDQTSTKIVFAEQR